MSGRLIILSKKGYCPWNARNVARIERDEKEHQEAQKQEWDRHAHVSSRARVAALKNNGHGKANHEERFNLFQLEEETSICPTMHSSHERECKGASRKVHGRESNSFHPETSHNNQNQKPSGTISHLNKFGDSRRTNRRKVKPFYMSALPPQESLGRNEIRRKHELDPMKDFARDDMQVGEDIARHQTKDFRNEIQQEQKKIDCWDNFVSLSVYNDDISLGKETRKDRKKKKRHKRDEGSRRRRGDSRSNSRKRSVCNTEESNDVDDFEQLRKKRREREKRERERQNKLLS